MAEGKLTQRELFGEERAATGRREDRDKRIAAMYSGGMTGKEIMQRLHVARETVQVALRNEGVAVRPKKRIYTLRQDVFDAVTEASAYWVGFLMADGCIRIRGEGGVRVNYVTLTTATRDRRHLEEFREFLGSDQPFHIIPPSESGIRNTGGASLSVSSRRLVEALGRYGVAPNKTHIARVIGLEEDRHFWRGLVCGDGSLGINNLDRPWLSLVGSQPIVEQFLAYAATVFPHKANCRRGKGAFFYTAFIGWRACALIRSLFSEAVVGLSRKVETACHILANFDPETGNRIGWESKKLTHKLTLGGETRTIKEWAQIRGLEPSLIRQRLRVQGWTVEQALSRPPKQMSRLLTAGGKTMSIADWARETGVPHYTIERRLSEGWREEDAVTTPQHQPKTLTAFGKTLTVAGWAARTGLSRGTIRARLGRCGWTVERALAEPV